MLVVLRSALPARLPAREGERQRRYTHEHSVVVVAPEHVPRPYTAAMANMAAETEGQGQGQEHRRSAVTNVGTAIGTGAATPLGWLESRLDVDEQRRAPLLRGHDDERGPMEQGKEFIEIRIQCDDSYLDA